MLRQLLCTLKGHPSAMLTFQDHRMALRCHECGWISAGWDLRKGTPKPQHPITLVQYRAARRREEAA